MSEKIVVIGSNSFSGASLVDFVLGQDLDVVGISRSPEPNEVFLPYKKRKNPAFKFYQLDLNHNLKEIMEVINGFKPDYVINFAAQSMVEQSWQHPEHWFQTNAVANVKLHDNLRHCNFLKKYIHVSTPEVYGTCRGLIKENLNYNPSTPYGVSRVAADLSLMTFYKTYNFPVSFTRAANVYGPGQQFYRIIPRSVLFFLIGRKLELHGGGQSVRSFIHMRDVSDGTLKVARDKLNGEIYHFSTQRNITVKSLVQMIAQQLGVSFEDNVNIVGERLGKDSAYLLDSSKAIKMLGWKDKVSLEQGLEETIKWVKDNLETIKQQSFDYIHKA